MDRITRKIELRAEGRSLTGIVLPYGEVSPSHRERFEAGALRFAETVPLNVYHEAMAAVAWQPGGGLELADSDEALTMRADLPGIPAADHALAEVRAGNITGLSVEFRAEKERMENGIRVIEQAVLSGIGLVSDPSYQGARVEARARRRRTWL